MGRGMQGGAAESDEGRCAVSYYCIHRRTSNAVSFLFHSAIINKIRTELIEDL